MTGVDWVVLGAYILLMIVLGWWIGRRQHDQLDYYLGGRKMPAWQVALSILATQVSAISLIGAPAFIALRQGGGLVWLQYEFAIPLAMIGIMGWLLPHLYGSGDISIYAFLERRFGTATRLSVSAIFLSSRALGSGVALLATSIITAVCLDIPLLWAIAIIGAVSVLYTTQGGIVADIYSDILQLGLLWGGTLLTIILLWSRLEDPFGSLLAADRSRLTVFNIRSSGLGDGQSFSFWPMLIGGIFLYMSYYGFDQSQAQRVLTSASLKQSQKSLLINGLLRFPVVLSYCAVGLLLMVYIEQFPVFAGRLTNAPPDFLLPYFLREHFPAGLLGLTVAGIFAASMSSLDSALNSLSAVTWTDFILRWRPSLGGLPASRQLWISRLLTILWGIVTTSFALVMVGGSETVLEMVNKIGSAFYGPILAVFLLGLASRRACQPLVLTGLCAGVGLNVYLWLFQPGVAWMWWNLFGFTLTYGLGWVGGRKLRWEHQVAETKPDLLRLCRRFVAPSHLILLLVAFFMAMMVSFLLQIILT